MSFYLNISQLLSVGNLLMLKYLKKRLNRREKIHKGLDKNAQRYAVWII